MDEYRGSFFEREQSFDNDRYAIISNGYKFYDLLPFYPYRSRSNLPHSPMEHFCYETSCSNQVYFLLFTMSATRNFNYQVTLHGSNRKTKDTQKNFQRIQIPPSFMHCNIKILL